MGVEGVGSELADVSVESGSKENNLNGGLGRNEPIKFGTHGSDEPIRVEANNISEDNFPKDAVDEWPEAKQRHSFYFVKFRSLDDPKLKAKLDQADKDLQRLNQARFQITEKIRAKRADRGVVIDHLKALGEETRQFREIMDVKRKEIEPLQQALGKLRGPNNAGRERGSFICSSEEELNDLIKSLHFRIQHESIPLSEEKQILREIKLLEGTRDQVLANAAEAAKVQVKMGKKEAIQDQVKLIGADLDGVRKDRQVVKVKVKYHEDEKMAIDIVIKSLEAELDIATEKRDKAFEKVRELRKQREEGNVCFYENCSLLTKVRDLAAKKDIEALKELSASEVDKFMSPWSSIKAFRDDYEKRILPSLDMRQLSRDARMRNPGEKPLVSQEAPTPSETEVLVKPKVKQAKEDSVPPPQPKEEKNSKQKTKGAESTLDGDDEKEEEVFELEKKVEKNSQKTKEVDVAKLKEMKREEEAAKAKQAMERKKKLAEKAAAKAAAKAQKEAEKKIKEREKKAKKKLQASSAPVLESEEATEAAAVEATEPEKAIDENVTAPVPSKSKERKENTTRHRSRAKGPESLSKVILKRKKSTNYWYWAGLVGVCVAVLLVIGYNYF